MKGGTDLDCGRTYGDLVQAVHDHLLSEADIDASVVRLFTARMRLGMFDPAADVPFNTIPYSEVEFAPAHRELALQAAREIDRAPEESQPTRCRCNPRSGRSLWWGRTADLLASIEGNYNGVARDPVSPLQGMRKQFGSANVIYAPGSILADGTPAPVPSAYLRTDASLKTRGAEGRVFRQHRV